MSKLAAIEARATQYPASTNDVVWLLARVRELSDAISWLSRGDCFCEAAIGNPMYRDHTTGCHAAMAALAALDEPNVPIPS